MLSNATSTAWINLRAGQHQRKVRQHQRKGRQGEDDAAQTANVTKEKRNENQNDQRIRGRPGQGPALLCRGTGLCQEGRFQSGPISLADRGLARGAGRHSAATGVEQQPRGQSVSAGDVSTEPARGHVFHRQPAGRLRAYESAWRRLYYASNRRHGIQDRHAERYVRQSHSNHSIGGLAGEIDDRRRAIRARSRQLSAGTERWREVDAHSRPRNAPRAGESLGGAYRPGATARM